MALSESDLKLLRPKLKRIALAVRYPLEEPNKSIKHVYFMEEGIASVVALGERESIEIGIIGREGMSGIPVVLGDHRSPHSTYIQVAGAAECMKATDLRKAIGKSKTLHSMLLRSAQAFGVQTAHTAVANGRANIEERLARWLLMAHDRLGTDALALTHEFLALMLSVRRPGVTVALKTLRAAGLIRPRRGKIHVIDRVGLKKVAGGYYGTPERELDRLIARNS